MKPIKKLVAAIDKEIDEIDAALIDSGLGPMTKKQTLLVQRYRAGLLKAVIALESLGDWPTTR